jgi:drug/metabolite transporter (DMT)-like permease
MIELNFIFNLKRNKLFAINFWQGIIVSGVAYYLQAWVLEKKGPVFLAMFTPLALIMTIFSSAILLGEIINLGR